MTSTYTQITEENLYSFPIGSRVEFNYGAMYGSEFGLVVDYRVTEFGADLIAETESGEIKYINGFSTVGVGVRLVELA